MDQLLTSGALDHVSRFLFNGSIPSNSEPALAACRLDPLEGLGDDVNNAGVVTNSFAKPFILCFTQTRKESFGIDHGNQAQS